MAGRRDGGRAVDEFEILEKLAARFDRLSVHHDQKDKDVPIKYRLTRGINLGYADAYSNAARQIREELEKARTEHLSEGGR